MFTPKTTAELNTAALTVDDDAIRDLISDTVGPLSKTAQERICAELKELFDFIHQSPLQGETFWQAFQAFFGFAALADDARITPMNAANLCPEPRALIRAANILRLEYNTNVSQQMRSAEGIRVKQIETARAYIAEGLGLSRDSLDVALVRNSSAANNAISAGYSEWTANDNVVLWNENHPTNLEAWKYRAEWNSPRQDRFQPRIVEFDIHASDDDIANAFIRQIDKNTRFLSYTDTSNISGFRIPESVMAALWQHIHDNRIPCHIHIDGTMAWGARSINLSQTYCHSFASSAHKWFLGPKETGILWMNPEYAQKLAPSIFAYNYKIEIGDWQEMPENALRFELLGQRDDINLIMLAFTQMFWTALGPRKPYERVAELAQYFVEQLQRSGSNRWQFVTPTDPDRRWGVVRVHAEKGHRASNLYTWLYETKAYQIAGSGDDLTFRLCPHIYNTKADIDKTISGMNAWYELE